MKKHGRVKAREAKIRKIEFHRIKTWQLLVILVPLLFLDATLLRQDHIRMTELRSAVLAADEAEDDAAIATTLEALKAFTFSNIVVNVVDDNGDQQLTFGTGTFYLEHQYIRAANAALQEAEANLKSDANPNGNIYAAASEVCKGLAIQNGWTWSDAEYINCMTTEIEKYPAAADIEDTIKAVLPSTELYRHNYVSPVWAPTWAGWMILITCLIIVVIIMRMIIWIVLRISLLFV